MTTIAQRCQLAEGMHITGFTNPVLCVAEALTWYGYQLDPENVKRVADAVGDMPGLSSRVIRFADDVTALAAEGKFSFWIVPETKYAWVSLETIRRTW